MSQEEFGKLIQGTFFKYPTGEHGGFWFLSKRRGDLLAYPVRRGLTIDKKGGESFNPYVLVDTILPEQWAQFGLTEEMLSEFNQSRTPA